MVRRMILPLVFGVIGAAILISLGVWQLQRLAWKDAVLAEIDARILAEPVAIPELEALDPERDRYLPVEASGNLGAEYIRILVSQKIQGPGYRIIAPFEVGGRVILLDRGIISTRAEIPPAPEGRLDVLGNLHWPDDRNSSTPDNDIDGNFWFARDIAQMADVLGTEPILMIAREVSEVDSAITPFPVDSSSIPNDHLQYVITWFSLAFIWLGMTGYLLWRIRQRTV